MNHPIAVITGASSGIGRAYARFLAEKGHDVVLIARRKNKLKELAKEIQEAYQTRVEIFTADLSASEDAGKVYHKILQEWQPEVLVHAAGFGTRGHVVEIKPELLEQQVYLHNVAAAMLARAALPVMKDRKTGVLIFVSSVAAYISTAEYTVYSSTKAFLNTLATGLRDELAGTDIKVQAVCPGITRTEFMYTEQYQENNFDYSFIPDKFWMEPEEVVKESWKRLTHRYRPVVVAGRMNKVLVGLLSWPVVGPLFRRRISRMVRKKVAKGLPSGF